MRAYPFLCMFKRIYQTAAACSRLMVALFTAVPLMIGFGELPVAAVDIADAPMFSRIQPPPADIMVVLDDSGSMAFEILVRGTYDGRYPNPDQEEPGRDGYCFVFDEMGDNVYDDELRYMREEGRKYWQSQWYETNVMWYNPAITYNPWAKTATLNFGNSNPDLPRAHPHPDINAETLDLDETSYTVDSIAINHSHYYIRDEEAAGDPVYLVMLKDGAIAYYRITGTTTGTIATDLAEKVSTLASVDIGSTDLSNVWPQRKDCGSDPETVETCDYGDERQNFANWFTYYRRREYTAKAALGQVIKRVEGVRVAIYGINERIVMPLYPVKATIDAVLEDESDTLLNELYRFQSRGGTPLKEAMQTVGEFFLKNGNQLAGVSGDRPFPDEGAACQQIFTIVMTDGFYSDTGYNTKAGGADNDDGPPYADDYDDTLGDIARYYYETDLHPAANLVPTNPFDGNTQQHMVTYGVAFGVVGTLDPNDYHLDPTGDDYMKHKVSGDYIDWPQVSGVRQPESIDDLWHAAVNGHGEFLNAANPRELIDSLLAVTESIIARLESSAASVAINGDQLYAQVSEDIRVFQSRYSNTNDEWKGDVKAYAIDTTGGKIAVGDEVWSAADQLKLKSAGDRNILSYDPVSDSGIEFTEAGLTAAQEAEFAPYDVTDMVAYIRGAEIDGYRVRTEKLGDIVHSAPVFNADVVYVGANDGMLHAFNARPPAGAADPKEGEEIFAYVPDMVIGNLKYLADTAYVHRYYVDLTPVVKQGEALLADAGQQTLLVGGFGKGAKGFFGLDVTNPYAMTTAQVKWEFPKATTPAADRADMGFSFGRPVIAPSYGTNHKWIVIAANGYNSPNGLSVLFILNPRDGSVIRKIVAGTGPDNGLSTPVAVDVNLDKIVDFVYAGDLKGNLWKFDLRSTNPNDWDVAYKDGGVSTPLFLARGPESDADEAIQPITAKPDVMLHPSEPGYMVCFGTGKFLGDSDVQDRTVNTLYGIWDYGDPVFQFSTGWSDPADPEEFLGEFLTRDTGAASKQLDNQHYNVKLLKQEAADYSFTLGEQEVNLRVFTDNQPQWITKDDEDGGGQLPNPTNADPNNAGWYFDLTTTSHPDGERVVSDVILRDGKLLVISFNPEDSRCSRGGYSFFMEINANSGGRIDAAIFDISGDQEVAGGSIEDGGDYINIGTPEDPVWVPPTGIMFVGQLQPPAIMRNDPPPPPPSPGDDDDDDDDDDNAPPCEEVKIFSSSTGKMPVLTEVCANIGVLYWKEMQQE